ncbi:helical backbone metal receptor [Marinicella meishanensis]|uniref:helical backbone metal receptor n=1 Tax=Marinicella meishanensis TaxID=2873263 RepID=UPI001CC12D05|nr:helical backbone metal receptor [Marinicella sp. NBU2979]
MPKSLFLIAFWLLSWTASADTEPTFASATIKTSVSLSPHITELVYSAGGQDGLLGVSAYSDYPASVADKTVIGDAFHLNTELLAQLQPEVVFYWAGGTPQQTVEKLKSMQLNVHAVTINELHDIARAIQDIADTLGTQPTADLEHFATRLQALQNQTWSKQSALIQISDQPIYTVNGDHWMSEAIAVCGLNNVFADLATKSAAVTLESVVLKKPEVIVRTQAMNEHSPVAQWAEIPAIKNQRIAVLEADHFTRPTLRLLLAIEHLCQQVAAYERVN